MRKARFSDGLWSGTLSRCEIGFCKGARLCDLTYRR
jgi:hypothetical protein